ncbi:MAG TPA: 30S ribosomal protein S6 [Solirubrobacteraceae bacterium]|nr:30S ribosomal protein S6 [Solirubrobacteraceae bacterium]
MPVARPIYDLVLLLDLAAAEDVRAKALADTRAQIEASGELVLEQSWGTRALAYPIDHRDQAEYHLLQLHGDGPLIEALERNLRIADGVLRHRIIKLAPGTPSPPDNGARAASAPIPAAAPPEAAESEALTTA